MHPLGARANSRLLLFQVTTTTKCIKNKEITIMATKTKQKTSVSNRIGIIEVAAFVVVVDVNVQ